MINLGVNMGWLFYPLGFMLVIWLIKLIINIRNKNLINKYYKTMDELEAVKILGYALESNRNIEDVVKERVDFFEEQFTIGCKKYIIPGKNIVFDFKKCLVHPDTKEWMRMYIDRLRNYSPNPNNPDWLYFVHESLPQFPLRSPKAFLELRKFED